MNICTSEITAEYIAPSTEEIKKAYFFKADAYVKLAEQAHRDLNILKAASVYYRMKELGYIPDFECGSYLHGLTKYAGTSVSAALSLWSSGRVMLVNTDNFAGKTVEEWYQKGRDLERCGKTAQAMHSYHLSVLHGYFDETLLLAEMRSNDSAKWYEENRHTDKLLELGSIDSLSAEAIYQRIQDLKKNPKRTAEIDGEIIQCYHKSAELGCAEAQYELANLYYYVKHAELFNIIPSYVKAAKWYQKAAEQGHIGGVFGLGRCYRNGEGISKDIRKGNSLILEAAQKGFARAQYYVGGDYENGYRDGVSNGIKDERCALEWYIRAANQGNSAAQFAVAKCYFHGVGTRMSIQTGLEWMEKAAGGNQTAKLCMDSLSGIGKASLSSQQLYEYGEAWWQAGWYEKALEFFQIGANLGDKNAQNYMGFAYKHGKGVAKDASQARLWYRKAAAQGHQGAEAALADLGVVGKIKDAFWWL